MVTQNKTLQDKILIVDDEPNIVALLEQTFQGVGYSSLRSTMDPREVCSIFEKFKPDLILMDIHLPGLNGLDAFKKLQALNGTKVFLFLP